MEEKKYEKNYEKLEEITESLNRDEIGIDDLVHKTKEALEAARVCMDILNHQKGEFKKLEKDFSELLSTEAKVKEGSPEPMPAENDAQIGSDDPF